MLTLCAILTLRTTGSANLKLRNIIQTFLSNFCTMEKCKLCLQEKQLIAKSHIIPDFMYEELYDDNHKIRVVPASEFGKVKPRIKMPSSGEYEGGLLCSDCDNKLLGGYENYARKAIYGGALRDSECPECDNFKSQDGVKFTLQENKLS